MQTKIGTEWLHVLGSYFPFGSQTVHACTHTQREREGGGFGGGGGEGEREIKFSGLVAHVHCEGNEI